jgi:TonB family protein
MENMSGESGFVYVLAALFYQFPVLQQMADITIKSLSLLSVFWVLDIVIGRKLSSNSRHLLWINAFICLVMLPFIPAVFLWWQTLSPTLAALVPHSILIELPVYASLSGDGTGRNWSAVIVALYLIPASVLFGRLLFAMRSVRALKRSSECVDNKQLLTHLAALKSQLNISRNISLLICNRIESPVSFGLLKPQIMLPVQALEWNESTMTDVLLHELCHIKRLDWLTTLSAYVIASVFWFNPLVWLAVKRLREESENSCDTAVLNSGRSDTDYAESLLAVATSCIHARRNNRSICNNLSTSNINPLLQTMLDQNTLKIRISRVLKDNKMNATEIKSEIRKTAAIALVLSTALLGVLGASQVLQAQQQPDTATRTTDEEILPLNTIQPMYPTAAAEAGVEGWAQVSFTVSADGTVAEDSIIIVDAEPSDIFNNNAIAAAKQFLFSPRIIAGQSVDVPNVQYVFRFYMSQASERAAQQQ